MSLGSSPSGTGWAEALRLAAGRFGVKPQAFWRLSVREWRMLTAGAQGAALGRPELVRLMAAWPDGAAGVQARGFETRAAPAPQPHEP